MSAHTLKKCSPYATAFESNGIMTFASTRCPGSAVSLPCTIWGRALKALALSMFVKGKNTAFNQSINIIEFAEKWTGIKMGLVWRRGQTYKWRWRHLQTQVAPLLISGGATSKFRWRHLQLQVAPLAASSGATCSFKWRHLQLQVAPLLSSGGATSKLRWRN